MKEILEAILEKIKHIDEYLFNIFFGDCFVKEKEKNKNIIKSSTELQKKFEVGKDNYMIKFNHCSGEYYLENSRIVRTFGSMYFDKKTAKEILDKLSKE